MDGITMTKPLLQAMITWWYKKPERDGRPNDDLLLGPTSFLAVLVPFFFFKSGPHTDKASTLPLEPRPQPLDPALKSPKTITLRTKLPPHEPLGNIQTKVISKPKKPNREKQN
jgi:hypothetical protein